MPKRDFDIKSVLDVPRWEKVQDQLAKLTGTAIISIDFKGNPVTKHSERTDFCSVIRENSVSRKRCYRCDALAGRAAVRLERPYIYLCHCGIVDVAVPVMVGERYMGSVMFGQVRLPNKDKEKAVRLINEISTFHNEDENSAKELLEMYERLPEMEYSRIVEIAELISSIVEYVVDKAVSYRDREQTYQWLLRTSSENVDEIQEINTGLFSGEKSRNEDEDEGESVPKSSPVYPAVEYIKNHLDKKLTMSEMAQLCHISQSYFSRMFTTTVGENFMNYVNRQKTQRAKKLLRDTDKSVTQISTELGYGDVSTFIRLFKRFEGVTPQVYRQYRYK